jgi:hypothetical protein
LVGSEILIEVDQAVKTVQREPEEFLGAKDGNMVDEVVPEQLFNLKRGNIVFTREGKTAKCRRSKVLLVFSGKDVSEWMNGRSVIKKRLDRRIGMSATACHWEDAR